MLAGGLSAVDIDTGRYDRSLFMCGRAADYEGARSQAVGEVQTEFTRLLYAWAAYECVRRAGSATFGDGDEPGDKQVCAWLAREWSGPTPAHYLCGIDTAAHLATLHPQYEDLVRFLRPGPGYPEIVLGLRAAGQLRHRLAHGRLVHPAPAEWGGQPSAEALLARSGCRLLLLTLQMLLATLVKGHGLVEECVDEELDERQVPLDVALVEVGSE